MRKLYIVLIKAHTGIGSIARKVTGYPYTHIAVSLDPSMTDFISFSRRYHYYPFEAGFTHEYRQYYAFGRHSSFRAKVFELNVSKEKYAEVMAYIRECENDEKRIFNLFSMATMPLLGGFRIYKSDNCMSFTAKCIELSGCVKLDRPYWRYSIKDMDNLLTDHEYFEGRILRGDAQENGYMKPLSLIRYLRGMVLLFSKLTFRLLFKKT